MPRHTADPNAAKYKRKERKNNFIEALSRFIRVITSSGLRTGTWAGELLSWHHEQTPLKLVSALQQNYLFEIE